MVPSVGSTPLICVGGVYAKLECVNPTGSIKDRIVLYILLESERRGLLKPGMRIVEATSGNTGVALAFFGRMLRYPVTIVMPEHMTEERKELIRSLGADLVLCSVEGGFAEAATIRDEMARDPAFFNPDQFSNPLNVECHELTTAQEIMQQLPANVDGVDVFVAGVGTGGTLIGVGKALRERYPRVHLVAVEPAESAVMSGGENSPHQIYGIGDGFIPAIAGDGSGGVHPMIDEVVQVRSDDAIAASKELQEEYRYCLGVSSGANFRAAQQFVGAGKTVVTVFADGYAKYCSVGLGGVGAGECPHHDRCPGQVRLPHEPGPIVS